MIALQRLKSKKKPASHLMVRESRCFKS